jgi:hypothetical protein
MAVFASAASELRAGEPDPAVKPKYAVLPHTMPGISSAACVLQTALVTVSVTQLFVETHPSALYLLAFRPREVLPGSGRPGSDSRHNSAQAR